MSHLDDSVVYFAQLIGVGFFRVVVPNLVKADQILDWVKGQSGVTSVRMFLLKNRLQAYGALDVQLKRKLEEIGIDNPKIVV
jgi:hypothetical protein